MIVGVDPKNTELSGEELQHQVVRHLTTLLCYPLIGRLPDKSYVVSSGNDESTYEDDDWIVSTEGYVHVRKVETVFYLKSCKANSACFKGCGCKCYVSDGFKKAEGSGEMHCPQVVEREQATYNERSWRSKVDREEEHAYQEIVIQSRRAIGPQGSDAKIFGCFTLTGATGPSPPK